MASLRVIKGRLSAYSECEVKQKVATWAWWRIIDEDGKDVLIKNVRALEFMRSHVVHEEEGTYVFTKDGAPWFIALKYAHDGHVADGWKEWKDRRDGYPGAIVLGLLMIAPLFLAFHFDWGQSLSLFLGFLALFGLLGAAIGVFGTLGNLLSYRPSKAQIAAALDGKA